MDSKGWFVPCKHFMPIWLSDRSHVNKIILVWVCTAFVKPGHHCSWASQHVVQHPWELLDFSLRGVYMTLVFGIRSVTSSLRFPLVSLYLFTWLDLVCEFNPVVVPDQILILVWKTVPDNQYHGNVVCCNCQNKPHITMKNGFYNL